MILLVLVGLPLAYGGVDGLLSPDYFDIVAAGSVHFYATIDLALGVIAFLAALTTLTHRPGCRALGCAATALLTALFGFEAMMLAGLVPGDRFSVDPLSALVIYGLALGSLAAGLLLARAGIAEVRSSDRIGNDPGSSRSATDPR